MITRMKPQILLRALTLSVVMSALILAGCSTTESRIGKNPGLYQSLSSHDQALVSKGQIRPGMSQNAVWLAWGSADRKVVGNMHGKATETWIYVNYEYAYPPVYGPYGAYGPWGPWGGGVGFVRTRHHGSSFVFFGSPFYDPFFYSYIPPSIPVPYKTVTFANGRVASFQYRER